jgi:hypothetical protein
MRTVLKTDRTGAIGDRGRDRPTVRGFAIGWKIDRNPRRFSGLRGGRADGPKKASWNCSQIRYFTEYGDIQDWTWKETMNEARVCAGTPKN